MSLLNCRVVLVRPQIAENLGATARVMRNMGLRDLVLVAPEASAADRQARRLSSHGEAILDRARIVADFAEAVADCVFVAGTSARTGKLIRGQFTPPDVIMPTLVDGLRSGPVALVLRLADRGEQQVQVTGDVGHRADRRAPWQAHPCGALLTPRPTDVGPARCPGDDGTVRW